MRRAVAVAVAITVAVMAGGGAAANGPSPDVKQYVGGAGDLDFICPPVEAGTIWIGGNCFELTAQSVYIQVNDAINTVNIGFKVGWLDADGAQIGGYEPGCNYGVLAAPPLATSIKVLVDGPLSGPSDCGVALPEGVGITGNISVYA